MGVFLVRMEVKEMTSPKSVEAAKEAVHAALKGLDLSDAASVLSEAVTFHSTLMKPAEALKFTRAVGGKVEKRTKDISAAIIASVNGIAGAYKGFTVVDVDGRASVDTTTLKEKYPSVYDEVVSWGASYKLVRTTSAANETDEADK